jgi:hypothetical protein
MPAKPKVKRLSEAEKKKRLERIKKGYEADKKRFKGTVTEKYAKQGELAPHAKKRTKRRTRSA